MFIIRKTNKKLNYYLIISDNLLLIFLIFIAYILSISSLANTICSYKFYQAIIRFIIRL